MITHLVRYPRCVHAHPHSHPLKQRGWGGGLLIDGCLGAGRVVVWERKEKEVWSLLNNNAVSSLLLGYFLLCFFFMAGGVLDGNAFAKPGRRSIVQSGLNLELFCCTIQELFCTYPLLNDMRACGNM
jgi:hypothetical protein